MTTETAQPTRIHQYRTTRRDHARKSWVLKSCTRCGGDLILQTDEYGDQDYVCLQCGHTAAPAMLAPRLGARG